MNQSTVQRQGVGLRGVDTEDVSPGYVLFAHLTGANTVTLINTEGKEVHKWKLPHRVGRHARLLADGNLAVNCIHPDAPNLFPLWQKYRGGLMLTLSPSSEILSSYADPFAHHDQNHLPDGTILYAALHALSPAQAARIPGGIPGSEAPGGIVYADIIRHVDPRLPEGKQLLWEWKIIEHVDPAAFPLQSYAREHWPLINSVERMADGRVLASLRSVSSVIVIDYESKEVVWRLDSTVVAQQHCATELVRGEEKSVLIFDNGVFRHNESFPYSRALEVRYAPGSEGDKSIIWKYQDPNPSLFFSPFMGSAQRLQGGNTLITQAHTGRIFEVTAEGRIVWEYVVPAFATYDGFKDGAERELKEFFGYPANAVFRSYKYRKEEIPWLVEG